MCVCVCFFFNVIEGAMGFWSEMYGWMSVSVGCCTCPKSCGILAVYSSHEISAGGGYLKITKGLDLKSSF